MIIYLKNILRILGVMAFCTGGTLLGYQSLLTFLGGRAPTLHLFGPAIVPHWIFHAPLPLQMLIGGALIILVETPLPILLVASGAMLAALPVRLERRTPLHARPYRRTFLRG